MLTVISTTHRLVSHVLGRGDMKEVETPGEWLAYRGTVPNDDNSESCDALVVLTGNGSGVAGEATRWAVAEFNQQVLISFAYGSATNGVSKSANLTLATSCIKIEGAPISWQNGGQAPAIRTTARAYAAARKTVEHLGADFRAGDIISTSDFTRTIELKRWLNETFEVQAVDRDSYDIAEACIESRVGEFMIVRPVLDPINAVLPGFADRIGVRPRGLLVPRSVGYMIGHPSETRNTFRVIGHANTARRMVGRFVPRFLTEWNDIRSSSRNRNGT